MAATIFSNGLTLASNTVTLGGTLTAATTITNSTFDMIYNLSSTGDFRVQDNGADVFAVMDSGNTGIGTTVPVAKLHVVGNSTYSAVFMSGNVGIGTTSPGGILHT